MLSDIDRCLAARQLSIHGLIEAGHTGRLPFSVRGLAAWPRSVRGLKNGSDP
jgi:hypothetical protein